MGDTGFLKSANSQYRAHVYLSDVVRLGGRVVSKQLDGGEGTVTIETWAINQRGKDVMPGSAVVAVPLRDEETKAAAGQEVSAA
jgi:acyl dehydratase